MIYVYVWYMTYRNVLILLKSKRSANRIKNSDKNYILVISSELMSGKWEKSYLNYNGL